MKAVPKKIINLMFREKNIYKLVEEIMNVEGPRITALLGLPGIGKSAMVWNALHFIIDRKFFKGGVILINIKNT